jgi:hypothetical protein
MKSHQRSCPAHAFCCHNNGGRPLFVGGQGGRKPAPASIAGTLTRAAWCAAFTCHCCSCSRRPCFSCSFFVTLALYLLSYAYSLFIHVATGDAARLAAAGCSGEVCVTCTGPTNAHQQSIRPAPHRRAVTQVLFPNCHNDRSSIRSSKCDLLRRICSQRGRARALVCRLPTPERRFRWYQQQQHGAFMAIA